MELESLGQLCGANAWAEEALFGLLGAWAAEGSPAMAAAMADRHSMHHAWRAQQWRERLPVLADLDPNSLVADGHGLGPAIETLVGQSSLAQLVGVYRGLLPRLVALYRSQERLLVEPSDSSAIRTLQLVYPDLVRDWMEGESCLQELILTEEQLAGATTVTAAVWTCLLPPTTPSS